MNRLKLATVGACALVGAGLATMRLDAQPDSYRPVPTDGAYELVLPPGTYQTLVLAFEGGANTKVLKATLKAPSGEMTILVPAGETLVIPLSGAGWTLTQPASVKLTQPVGMVHATMITPAGPVKLDAAKK